MAYRDRERVKKTLRHEQPDRVPINAAPQGIAEQFIQENGITDPDYIEFCREGDFKFVSFEPAVVVEDFMPYLGSIPANTKISCWGYGQERLRTAEGYEAGSNYYPPLKDINTVEELRDFPFPDFSGADDGIVEQVREAQEKEFTVLGQMSMTILETAYRMRGMDQILLDLYERPDYVHYLFERICEQREYQARKLAEAGVDILRIGDDIATHISLIVGPPQYKEFIKPYHKRAIDAARSVRPDLPVKYHSDGNLEMLLPDLVDIGVNIINPVQPECMDLRQIKREWGDTLVLWGGMPVQSVFATGSRQEVEAYLDFIMEEIAPGGGYVLKFTNFLRTPTSEKCIKYFLDYFYTRGVYPA